MYKVTTTCIGFASDSNHWSTVFR